MDLDLARLCQEAGRGNLGAAMERPDFRRRVCALERERLGRLVDQCHGNGRHLAALRHVRRQVEARCRRAPPPAVVEMHNGEPCANLLQEDCGFPNCRWRNPDLEDAALGAAGWCVPEVQQTHWDDEPCADLPRASCRPPKCQWRKPDREQATLGVEGWCGPASPTPLPMAGKALFGTAVSLAVGGGCNNRLPTTALVKAEIREAALRFRKATEAVAQARRMLEQPSFPNATPPSAEGMDKQLVGVRGRLISALSRLGLGAATDRPNPLR